MKYKILILLLLSAVALQAQDEARILLRGKIIYRNVNVTGANIVNKTNRAETISNNKGEFEIYVKAGDILVFSSIQYTIKEQEITPEIIENNRLLIEVTQKIEALDEVVISPEDKEKYLLFQQEEISKFKDYKYADDHYSEVYNEALWGSRFQGTNILGVVGLLADAIVGKGGKKKKEKVKPIYERTSFTQIRNRYPEDFFTDNLKIPKDQINLFLYYCDDHNTSESIFLKKNEFELIEFMIDKSKTFEQK